MLCICNMRVISNIWSTGLFLTLVHIENCLKTILDGMYNCYINKHKSLVCIFVSLRFYVSDQLVQARA